MVMILEGFHMGNQVYRQGETLSQEEREGVDNIKVSALSETA